VYAFRLFFIVFTGEPSSFVREHHHAHHGQEGPPSMMWTVGVLAVLATIAGFLQWAPLWTPLTTWLDPVAPPLVEATSAQEWVTSGVGITIGLLGIGLAWLLYSAKRVRVPRALPVLVHKFYWDEAYDVLWYRSSDLVARGLYAFVERPLIAGSLAAVGQGFSLAGRDLGRLQSGLVRSYALALAGGLAVLVVIFLAVR
jgi:NADH-quinone oxidoreductase subunit L